MIRGSIPERGKRLISSLKRPDWYWGPLSLIFNVQRRQFPWEQGGRGIKLITHFAVLPKLRMHGAIPLLLPIPA